MGRAPTNGILSYNLPVQYLEVLKHYYQLVFYIISHFALFLTVLLNLKLSPSVFNCAFNGLQPLQPVFAAGCD